MAKATKMGGPTARSDRTRARIVNAATRLFVDQGYPATTIEGVAGRTWGTSVLLQQLVGAAAASRSG